MKLIQWLAFAFIVAIIAIRGFWPEVFALDKYSIGLLFLLAIPLLAPFLKKAKWFGAEFDFKENIQELSDLVEESKEEKKEIPKEKRPAEIIETFSAESAMNLVSQDPNLALAALRIEIERILRLAYKILVDPESSAKKGIRFLVTELGNMELLESIKVMPFNRSRSSVMKRSTEEKFRNKKQLR
jgi:hypothetical protein